MPDAEYMQTLYRMSCTVAAACARPFKLSLVEYKALRQQRKNRRGNEELKAGLVSKLYLNPDHSYAWQLSYFGRRMMRVLNEWIEQELQSRGLPTIKLALDKVTRLEDF